MTKIKNKDFIEIEYTGKLEDGTVFDTTDKAIAAEADLDESKEYGPIVICVGEGHVLAGIDKALEGKEPGSFTVDLTPEEGFGKKDPQFIQMISTAKFRKQQINPVPGLQINIDGMIGTIKTVSGGRTLVDFNHPLSGKNLKYDIKILKVVEDKTEQVKSVLSIKMGIRDPDVTVKDDAATVKFRNELPEAVAKTLEDEVVKLTGIKSVTFQSEKLNKD